jgi:hypothetical protein
MRSSILTVAIVVPLVLACGGGSGGQNRMIDNVPAPVVAPPPVPASPTVKLPFSKWKMEWIGDSVVDTFEFLPDGKFIDPAWPDDVCTWKQDGDKLHLEYNSGGVIYDGELVDDHTYGGTLQKPDGGKGNWRMTRKP